MERQCRLRCREGHLDIEEGDSRRSVFLEGLAAVVFASREISVSVCLLDELAARVLELPASVFDAMRDINCEACKFMPLGRVICV